MILYSKPGFNVNFTDICILGPAAMDIAWIGAGSADAYFHQGTTYLLIIIRGQWVTYMVSSFLYFYTDPET